jgi:hypothetical protein
MSPHSKLIDALITQLTTKLAIVALFVDEPADLEEATYVCAAGLEGIWVGIGTRIVKPFGIPVPFLD